MRQQSVLPTNKQDYYTSTLLLTQDMNDISHLSTSSQIIKFRQLMTTTQKIQIFLYTFLAYTSVHAVRTAYSSSKPYIPQQIGIPQTQIGIVDSLMIFGVSLGDFLMAFYPSSRPIRTIWLALFCCSIEFCLVPLSMTYMKGQSAFAILCILMFGNGFLTGFLWPNLLPVIHSAFSPDEQSTILGFWATCPNFGNIIGFMIMQLIVFKNGLSWQLGMYIAASYMMLNAAYIGFRVDQLLNYQSEKLSHQYPQITNSPKKQQNIKQPLLSNKPRQSQSNIVMLATSRPSQLPKQLQYKSNQGQNELPNFMEAFLKSPRVILLTMSLSLFKSVMYGITFWLPTYFDLIGFGAYSLYIPMTFDGASIVGSIILGGIFKQLNPNTKNIVLVPVLILLMIFFTILKIVYFSSVGPYFVIIGLTGLCLGGTYNTLVGLVTMELVRAVPMHLQSKHLRYYSALLLCFANLVTAITQIIISYGIGKNQGKLFGIFLAYSFVNFCCVIGLIIIQYNSLRYLNIRKQNQITCQIKIQKQSNTYHQNQSVAQQIQFKQIL